MKQKQKPNTSHGKQQLQPTNTPPWDTSRAVTPSTRKWKTKWFYSLWVSQTCVTLFGLDFVWCFFCWKWFWKWKISDFSCLWVLADVRHALLALNFWCFSYGKWKACFFVWFFFPFFLMTVSERIEIEVLGLKNWNWNCNFIFEMNEKGGNEIVWLSERGVFLKKKWKWEFLEEKHGKECFWVSFVFEMVRRSVMSLVVWDGKRERDGFCVEFGGFEWGKRGADGYFDGLEWGKLCEMWKWKGVCCGEWVSVMEMKEKWRYFCGFNGFGGVVWVERENERKWEFYGYFDAVP